MNFNLVTQKKANERKAGGVVRGQNFDFRFRRFISKPKDDNGVVKEVEETRFFISDKNWDLMNLDNKAVKVFHDRDPETGKVRNSLFLPVENEDGLLLKATSKNEGVTKEGKKKEKGRNFKSTELEDALVEAGVLEAGKIGENQYMKFVPISLPENKEAGIVAGTYYHIQKSTEAEIAEAKAAEVTEKEEVAVDENDI